MQIDSLGLGDSMASYLGRSALIQVPFAALRFGGKSEQGVGIGCILEGATAVYTPRPPERIPLVKYAKRLPSTASVMTAELSALEAGLTDLHRRLRPKRAAAEEAHESGHKRLRACDGYLGDASPRGVNSVAGCE